MKKIIFSILLTLSSIGMIFAIEVKLPKANAEGLSTNRTSINSSEKEREKDKTIFSVINFINKNLWRSFSVIAM